MKSWKHSLQVARAFSWKDWLVLLEAWWSLWAISFSLWRKSLKHVEDSTHEMSSKPAFTANSANLARHLRDLIGYASRLHVLPMTCLVRALALQRLLARRDIPSLVRIGANKSDGNFQAHAWLEVDGQTIGEPEDIVEKFKILSAVK